jgi:hypothetical protein
MRPVAASAARRAALMSLLALAAVVGCASMGPRNVTLSQADLQSLIERQFPRERRLFEVFDITLARPVIRLSPERNRITTELDLGAVERLSGRSMRGSFSLDHALRFEPSDTTVRLANVKVTDLRLEVGGTALQGQTARLSALLAERMLDDFVIYRASDEKREALRRAGVNNAKVVVTSRGVEVQFNESR